MPIRELPLDALSTWCRLNNVTFSDVKVAPVEGRGTGIVAERPLPVTPGTTDGPVVITVPRDLILSRDMVEEYAKENKDFRDLLDAAGRKSAREDILLFLLVQVAISSEDHHPGAGIHTPWTTYVRFLPGNPPVPTLWSDREKELLAGTSLEPALYAKLLTLNKEFEGLKASSSDLLSWFELFFERETISLRDWLLVDALFRSRCVELSDGQSAMVPCIDMANHSQNSTAHYETNSKEELGLELWDGRPVSAGNEITINYGEKSPAEMLFSYGFVDLLSPVQSLVLPFDPLPDDPLAKAKLYSFGKAPTVTVTRQDGHVRWNCPFAYLACLNEEDGLQLRILQETDGSQHPKAFWMGMDVTEKADKFETLIQDHSLCDVFRLRAISVVFDRIDSQLERLKESFSMRPPNPDPPLVRAECWDAAFDLMSFEAKLLENVADVLEEEKTQLLASKNVVAYLGSTETTHNEDPSDEASNDVPEFG